MSHLTDEDRIKLNYSTPENQDAQLGDIIYGAPMMLEAEIAAAANVTAVSIDVPFNCEVVDVIVQARAASAAGTATLRVGTNAITNGIAMAANNTMARAGTIDDAYSTLSEGDNLNVITNGAADRGLVQVICKRI